jgi:hypothetical protein
MELKSNAWFFLEIICLVTLKTEIVFSVFSNDFLAHSKRSFGSPTKTDLFSLLSFDILYYTSGKMNMMNVFGDWLCLVLVENGKSRPSNIGTVYILPCSDTFKSVAWCTTTAILCWSNNNFFLPLGVPMQAK